MKKVLCILTVILLTSFTIQLKTHEGVYEYKADKFYESIELGKDFNFKYEYHFHSLSYSLEGDYSIKGDSLILDSNPQRDKIIVREYKKGNKNNVRFCVTDKLGTPINYTLYAINKENDTITLSNQWHKSKLKNKELESFYIIDSKGLKTPLYNIEGEKTNYFEVQMETVRVLDNEVWKIKDNSILPKGMNSKNQNYFLNKR